MNETRKFIINRFSGWFHNTSRPVDSQSLSPAEFMAYVEDRFKDFGDAFTTDVFRQGYVVIEPVAGRRFIVHNWNVTPPIQDFEG